MSNTEDWKVEYEQKDIYDLTSILYTARQSGSASVKDLEEMIVRKYYQLSPSQQEFIQGGGGMQSESARDIRDLVNSRKGAK